jgi:UDP-N-acetylglucosamine diphosphorylase/glucosamine-1-phosphate N-acetyltransferase
MIDPNNQPAPWAIIMAAGKGTRMGGDQPKVLYEVAGRPMVHWVVDACRQAGCETCVVIVGYQGEKVRAALADDPAVQFVEQTEQLGTGHAVEQARPVMENLPPRDVFVLAGDGPLIRGRTLARLLEAHRRRKASATLATSLIDDPTGYGRIVRTASGDFEAIVEQKDATPQQLAINEVNPSYYCFGSDDLFRALDEVSNENASGEYYITDVPAILKQQGKPVAVIEAVPPEDVLSINNPQQLAEVDTILRNRR